MHAVGLVPHPDRPAAHALAAAAAATLADRGVAVRVPASIAVRAGLEAHAVADAEFAPGLDLVVALGGDGTMLHAVHLVYPHPVPIIGVNAGRLGYLTTLEADELLATLPALLDDLDTGFVVAERMVLAADVVPPEGPARRAYALNEVVLEKIESGRLVDLAVEIAGSHFTTFSADGVIVATPTGSTAYAFSVRGPIVSPQHRCLVVAPVAAHMLFDRTLILGPDEVVEFEVGARTVAIALDGHDGGALAPGTRVRCSAAADSVCIVTRRGRAFHQILRDKFALPERAHP
jgi:NAD+ kinase